MAITRGPVPADHFTIIDNRWLRDPDLSWKAKGLLAYIASHAPGHRLTRDQMLAEGKDGRDAVIAGLCELEERGYLRRVIVRGEGAKIAGTDYELCDPSEKPSSGKPGPGADQAQQGVSAGGSQDGFSGSGEPVGKKTTSQKTEEKNTSSPSARRGTRLPEDFTPDAEMRTWYAEKIGGAIDGLIEHEKFMNYWLSKSGSGATKVDWRRTWMNWMLNALPRSGARPAPGGSTTKPGYQTAQERSSARLAEERALLEEAERIVEAQGGNPEDSSLVRPIYEELKSRRATAMGSATRTSGMYSEGDVIDGEVVPQHREVTAGEGQ